MQRGKDDTVQDSLSKPIMLGLVTAIVIGILAPLVIPHVTHPTMIYHIMLHIASLTIAVFLTIVSVLAYRRSAGARLLFMMLGFIALAAVEFLYLLDSTAIMNVFNFSTLGIELPHVILLLMLAMFGLGFLRVNK